LPNRTSWEYAISIFVLAFYDTAEAQDRWGVEEWGKKKERKID
jgi:hypothetical protein